MSKALDDDEVGDPRKILGPACVITSASAHTFAPKQVQTKVRSKTLVSLVAHLLSDVAVKPSFC